MKRETEMNVTLAPSTLPDRLMIRERLEMYLGSLDEKNWNGIASCFTESCEAYYNNEPERINGGKGVANWLRRMVAYNATNHALSNVRVEMLSPTKAIAHSLVIATLHQGEDGVGRVQVRAIDYVDTLIKSDDVWLIEKRVHQPTLQYDALSQRKILY